VNPRRKRITARSCLPGAGLLGLGLFVMFSLAGCASGEFRDGVRFWGDHAGAAVFGDDPAQD